MKTSQQKIQQKWKEGYVLGYDCITHSNGEIVIGEPYSVYDPNNKKTKRYWSPICDTTLDKIEKYNEDIWTECDIWHGAFEYNNQKIVFGDGGMGNEGYIASTTKEGLLNWSIFFTFSNPICKAEVIENKLICYGDGGIKITIDLNELSNIKVDMPKML